MTQFGKKKPGTHYKDRPGAYALIFNDAGDVAVMKNPNGFFLPGGGTDGEAPEVALAREILEEAGLGVRIIREVGTASQYCFSDDFTRGYNKLGTFYLAAFTEKIGEAIELDHELVWLPLDQARAKLNHEFQRWALERALAQHISIVPASRHAEAQALYTSVGYKDPILPEDVVLVVEDAGKVVGVVRLAQEHGHLILRGMMIAPSHQKKGLGSRMLQELSKEIGNRECYCLPHGWLEGFYGQIGFVKIADAEAPAHLQERLRLKRPVHTQLMAMVRKAS